MRQPPTLRGIELFNFGKSCQADLLQTLLDVRQKHGPTVFLSWPTRMWLFFAPDDVQEIINVKNKMFIKDPRVNSFLRRGVVFSNTENWQQQRKGLAPVFRKNNLQNHSEINFASVKNLFDVWDKFTTVDTFDVAWELNKLSLRHTTLQLFGYNFGEDEEEYIKAVYKSNLEMIARYSSPFYPLLGKAIEFLRRRSESEKIQLAKSEQIVDSHNGQSDANLSIISHLLNGSIDNSPKTRDHLIEEVISLTNATFATTSATFSWLLYVLGSNPETKKRLIAEIDQINDQEILKLSQLSKLTFTEQVIDETTRLYPAVAVLKVRIALEDADVNGVQIRRGDRLMMSPFVSHRDSAFWERPFEFDPERFSEENRKKLCPFSFFPFGAGARSCLGKHMAIANLKYFLYYFFKTYDFKLAPQKSVRPMSHLVCRPVPGLFISIWKRKK